MSLILKQNEVIGRIDMRGFWSLLKPGRSIDAHLSEHLEKPLGSSGDLFAVVDEIADPEFYAPDFYASWTVWELMVIV